MLLASRFQLLGLPSAKVLVPLLTVGPMVALLILNSLPHKHPRRRQLPPPPKGFKRTLIAAREGREGSALDKNVVLELVEEEDGEEDGTAVRTDQQHLAEKAPILMLHGGFGSAICYYKWLHWFKTTGRGRRIYAVSLSGHGASTRPQYFHLLNKNHFAGDLLSAVKHIKRVCGKAPILVGHSAGGGLSQYFTDIFGEGGLLNGLVLVSPFPSFGGWRVYLNWFILDPYFSIRMLWQMGDPASVLSTPRLVARAFFGTSYFTSQTPPPDFFEDMNTEESIAWPSSMMFRFVNTERVKMHLKGEDGNVRLALIAGTEDRLMTPAVMEMLEKEYGCGLVPIDGAGHHLMHDIQWEEGAKACLDIIEHWGV
ncbi:alpha/beta-hydrolase [Meredithblackwellia eburnea MCA 4105]